MDYVRLNGQNTDFGVFRTVRYVHRDPPVGGPPDLDEGQDDESPYEVGDASEEEVVEVKKSVEPKKSASAAMLEMLSSESGSESSLEEESKGREGKRRCPPLGAILVD